ncbi:unnamed protein product, partial [Amoebophrya sp. A25]
AAVASSGELRKDGGMLEMLEIGESLDEGSDVSSESGGIDMSTSTNTRPPFELAAIKSEQERLTKQQDGDERGYHAKAANVLHWIINRVLDLLTQKEFATLKADIIAEGGEVEPDVAEALFADQRPAFLGSLFLPDLVIPASPDKVIQTVLERYGKFLEEEHQRNEKEDERNEKGGV